jgi:[ribosomal protein S5]-alanine N-acetyltransferase
MSGDVIELSVPGYVLRAWRESDAEAMHRHLNRPEIGRNMADWFPKDGYTLAMAQEWVTGGHATMGGVSHAIAWRGNGGDEVIGAGGVHPQDGFARCNAEIGYWLSLDHHGKGVGTALVRELTRQALADSAITRVFAPIHAHNAASQRICEKNGFINEGLRRKSVMKWGAAIDTVVWAVYRDVWHNTK